MIKFSIQTYCHGCPDFEPVCHTLFLNGLPFEQIVECNYRERCENIQKHMETVKQDEN